MTSKSLPALLAVLPVGLLATACGDDDGGGTGSASMTMTATDTPTTTETPTTDEPTTDTPTTTNTPTTDDPTTDSPTTDEPTTDDPTTGTPGADAVFRFASMEVRDPHFLASTLFGCRDVTDEAPLGMPGVNDSFNEAINMDTDGDNILDLSLMLIFRGGIDQADGGSGDMDFANGQCEVAGDCDIRPNSQLQPTTYDSQASGTCHEADQAHLSSQNYSPAPGITMGPCFHAGPSDVTIVTSSFELPLIGAEIAATFQGDPATSFMSGTLRGFLTRAVAEATMLPEDLAGNAGVDTVAGLMPGHPDCCANHDDTDTGPNGEDGWWFYVDFTALGATWVGP